MLSGLSPFVGDSDAETYSNIVNVQYDFEYEVGLERHNIALTYPPIRLDAFAGILRIKYYKYSITVLGVRRHYGKCKELHQMFTY